MSEDLKKGLLREVVLHNPLLFYRALRKPNPSSKPIIPFLHQAQPLYHAMITRPVRMLIADEIGLGKTLEAIAIARYLQLKGEVKRILVLVPKILREQWKLEVERAGGRANVIESGLKIERGLRNTEGKFTIVSIDLAKREEHRDKFLNESWDLLIVDEAHNVTPNTQRYDFVKTLITAKADYLNVILLSATPHRGDPCDYIKRLLLLDHTLADDCRKLDSLSRAFYSKTHNTLVFRRTKKVVNELEGRDVFPNCSFEAVVVDVTPEERAFLESLDGTLYEMVKNVRENSPIALLAVLLRKRASSSYHAAIKTLSRIVETANLPEGVKANENVQRHIQRLFGLGYEELEIEEYNDVDDAIDKIVKEYAPYLDRSQINTFRNLLQLAGRIGSTDSKVSAVAKLIKNHIKKGEKVIVFTEFKDTLFYLKDRLFYELNGAVKREEIAVLYGGMKSTEIEEQMQKFEKRRKLLIATDVASEGLNLQVASVVINYEAPWTPIKLEQRIGRVWRLSQTRDTTAYTVFLDTSMDLHVLENLYERIMNIAEAVGATPIVGKRVLRAKDITELWKEPEDGNGSSEKVISEYDLVFASIRHELGRYSGAIARTIYTLKRELETKNILPAWSPNKIKEELRNILRDSEFDRKRLDSILKDYVLRILGAKSESSVSNLLYGVITSNYHLTPIKIGVKSDKPLSERVYRLILSGKSTDREIHSYPVLIRREDGKIRELWGVDLIGYLKEVLSKEFIILGEAEVNRRDHGRLMRIAREKLYPLRSDYESYDKFLLRKSLKKEKLFEDTVVKYDILLEIVHLPPEEFEKEKIKTRIPEGILDRLGIEENELAIPSEEELIQSQRNFLPTESIIEAEKKAMEIVMKIEREYLLQKYGEDNEGELWKVEDVSLHSHYDVEVQDLGEGITKFIEVKGHLPLIFHAELTTMEREFAETHPDEYWVYIVANLRKRPLMLKIHRPFSQRYRAYLVIFDASGMVKRELDVTNKLELETIIKERSLIRVKLKLD